MPSYHRSDERYHSHMDTSVVLCISTVHSLTHLGYSYQWPIMAKLPRVSSFDCFDDPMPEQHHCSPYKRLNVFVRSTKPLDERDRQAYHGSEIQAIKNSLRIFLQGTEAIDSPREKSLFCSLESGQTHRALSPCTGITYNCIFYTLRKRNYSPGVFLDHNFCCGLEGVRFFVS